MGAPTEYDPSAYPPFAVTADVAVFTMLDGQLHVALIERKNDPYKGRWALPGGFVDPEEDLPEAAARELAEETGIRVPVAGLNQLGAYGTPGRDPRMRVVAVAFWTTQPGLAEIAGSSDAASAALVDVKTALAEPEGLAFDHHRILSDAMEVVQTAVGSSQWP